MSRPDQTFQRLCHEAVVACGDDIAAVERYVFDKIADMDEESRKRVRRDIERALFSVEPSDKRAGALH